MPFDEEPEELAEAPNNNGLKKISSKKSIFDSKPKKPNADDLKETVKKIENNNLGYKKKAAEIAILFKKALGDKTLPQNKSIFLKETEQELLSNLINFAEEINQDPNEQESMGSLMCITLLLKTCFHQRDRINLLEYDVFQLKNNLQASILKEIRSELDKKKNNE